MTTTFAYPEAPAEHGRGGRVEGELKVSGQLMYADDLALPGLLYVAAVRSPYPHARIVSINTEAAQKVPGVHLVLTGADVADIRFGRAVYDVPILAVNKVRFTGEMVVAVAAESAAVAEEAAALVDVEYQPGARWQRTGTGWAAVHLRCGVDAGPGGPRDGHRSICLPPAEPAPGW